MTPTGWTARYDATWPGPDKWIASNLDTGQTVFGKTEDEAWNEAEALDLTAGIERPRAPGRWAMGAR